MPWINFSVNGQPIRFNNETNEIQELERPARELIKVGSRELEVGAAYPSTLQNAVTLPQAIAGAA